jgi:DNA-binding XRE family transcriptional regulator/putative component of toxin-antitoxin plasmid stabilization module
VVPDESLDNRSQLCERKEAVLPKTKVVFYREEDGTVPLLEWFDGLAEKAQDKCVARLERLRELGHELRRPEADILRDGIYELRAKQGNMNFRMLYFFQARSPSSSPMALPSRKRPFPLQKSERQSSASNASHWTPSATLTRSEGPMATKRQKTSDAVEVLHRRYYAGKPQRLAALAEARASAAVARKVYELRTRSGLSQRELAKLVGTTASVICRLEDDDYEGHSLAMLLRIATALDQRVEIRFVPLRRKRRTA